MTEKESVLKNIELRSEEIEEILGKPPKGIIRSGISIITAVIVILFLISFFFKYPDKITSSIILTSENIPAKIVAKSNGKIISLFVKDNQMVKENEVLAVIENTAFYDDVISLSKQLDSLKAFISKDSIVLCTFNKNYILGDLQS